MSHALAIGGIHHITAITGSAAANLSFYEHVLGLRLVKHTVNFDDPFTYHLYYGDERGTPGTILTFFPWQDLPRGTVGAGMIVSIAFSIAAPAIDYWHNRLQRHHIPVTTTTRFGETVLAFSDPDGMQLELVADPSSSQTSFAANERAGKEHAIYGFHSATELIVTPDPTQSLLTGSLKMTLLGREGNRLRFHMGEGRNPARVYDLLIDPAAQPGRQGTGTVHHIAFRTADQDEQIRWQHQLQSDGYQVTPVRDRKYFTSIYFHEPAGVLFEIATDPPGFTVDEPLEQLGQALQLPSPYEAHRRAIVSRLPPLRPTEFVHRFVEPHHSQPDDLTIVALHGTGGNENDLVPMARQIGGGSAIISPRGQERENGILNRFFKRLAEGVFDEQDLVRRTHQLADFLTAAAAAYRRNPDQMVGLGYSNGATMAAAILLLRPEIFSRAILLRPMLPLSPTSPVDLSDKRILVLRGAADTVIPAASTDALINTLSRAGADVNVITIPAGHELTDQDIREASCWLAQAKNIAASA